MTRKIISMLVWIAFSAGFALPATAARFINNGDGTVTDTKTGLMWEQTSNGSGNYWAGALSHCQNLNVNGIVGWRLPNIKELLSVHDLSRFNPAWDTTVFSLPYLSNLYWSSTTVAAQPGHAFSIYGYDGSISPFYKQGVGLTRCVR